jgi:uncharacterized protein YjeT (DUF2065 family)
MSDTLVTALGLVLVLEGLTYALVPGQMKKMMAMLQETSAERLRMIGTAMLAAGVFVIWLASASMPA